jgi:hypothetical protein
MKWTWDGKFRASKQHANGTKEEKLFSSSAQARQFVEKHNNECLVKQVNRQHGVQHSIRIRKRGSSNVGMLTVEQTRIAKQLSDKMKLK